MHTVIDEQRAECARHFLHIGEADPQHTAPDGLRARYGRWKQGVPLGPEALTYAQIDAWREDAYRNWRHARRAELEGRLPDAESHYREAAALLGAVSILLDAIAERRGGSPCR